MLEKICAMLEREKFAKWYKEGNFDAWITGEDTTLIREDILEDLNKMLG